LYVGAVNAAGQSMEKSNDMIGLMVRPVVVWIFWGLRILEAAIVCTCGFFHIPEGENWLSTMLTIIQLMGLDGEL